MNVRALGPLQFDTRFFTRLPKDADCHDTFPLREAAALRACHAKGLTEQRCKRGSKTMGVPLVHDGFPSTAMFKPNPKARQMCCKASTKWAMSSSECRGVGVRRSRSVPRGTVGELIGCA